MISGVWCKIVPFLCNSPLWYFFPQSFIFLNFFGTPMVKRKTVKLFFSQNQKFRKANSLKFNKDWITESQTICKIIRRKFPIFSSSLIFLGHWSTKNKKSQKILKNIIQESCTKSTILHPTPLITLFLTHPVVIGKMSPSYSIVF